MISPAVLAAASRPAVLAAYAAMVAGVPGLVAYWRLGDTTTATLADSSGNGHNGNYSGSPALGAEELTWQDGDGRAVNFNAAGYGEVAHNAAFVLPRGTLSFYFRLNNLSATRTLLHKGTGFVLQVNTAGQLVLTMGSTTFQMQNTAVTLIGTGIEYHCMVQWGVKRVRLYLDGRQVAWGMAHQSGLTGTSAWQFGRTTGGTNMPIRLDEVALYSRELSRAELDALSEHIRGLPYGPPESTVVVSSAAALETAVNAAPPGRHILVADGTYSFGTRTFTASGAKRRPIVIRPQNNRGDVTFTSPTINMNGSWLVIADIFMTSPRIRAPAASRYNRITRCRFRVINSHAIDFATPSGYFWRLDHCDHADYTDGNNRNFVRIGSDALRDGYGKGLLVDHLYAHDISITAGTGGGANEIVAIGTTSRHALPSHPFATVEKCLFQNVNLPGEGEVVHGKANDTVFDRLNFVNCPNMYLSLRGGWHCQIISVWFENMSGSSGGFNAWGPDHYIAGCRFASSAARAAPAGNVTLQQRLDGADGYPFALNTQIIGCTGGFTVGSYWSSGQAHPATNVRIEACSPAPTLVSGWHTGTSQSSTTTEPFTPAVRLTPADVGMAADDPLVPDGWL